MLSALVIVSCTCFRTGQMAEIVTYFLPDSASLRMERGLSTVTIVSKIEISVSVVILCQVLQSSARTAQIA